MNILRVIKYGLLLFIVGITLPIIFAYGYDYFYGVEPESFTPFVISHGIVFTSALIIYAHLAVKQSDRTYTYALFAMLLDMLLTQLTVVALNQSFNIHWNVEWYLVSTIINLLQLVIGIALGKGIRRWQLKHT